MSTAYIRKVEATLLSATDKISAQPWKAPWEVPVFVALLSTSLVLEAVALTIDNSRLQKVVDVFAGVW